MLRRDQHKRARYASPSSDDEYDAYMTYRPLSNLPTPPPSLTSSAVPSPKNTLKDGERVKPQFLGPAIHLVNMIPSAASLATPSVPLVQTILGRANLPRETIALAVCVLDALDRRFAPSWRLSCPLTADPSAANAGNKRHTLPAISTRRPLDAMTQQLHIDSVRPELIILAALVIAAKFLDDRQSPSGYYAAVWGGDAWSCAQLNATERCIAENLDYRIMPLCDEDLLADAMVDMQFAAGQRWEFGPCGGGGGAGAGAGGYPSPAEEELEMLAGFHEEKHHGDFSVRESMARDGRAVVGPGLTLTPGETPPS